MMNRWSNSDTYGLFAGLVEQSPVETRDRAVHTLYQSRVSAIIDKQRRREKRAAQAFASLCWGLVVIVAIGAFLLASACVDDPSDHYGPDERAHVRQGHSVVGSAQWEVTR